MENLKFLVIGGVSGVGKTYLRDALVQRYPEKYCVVKQVTTRSRRVDEPEDAYIFLKDKSEYDSLHDQLVGRTEINGNYYGSLIVPEETRICVIILNEEGIRDFRSNKVLESNSLFIALDKAIDQLDVRREGRDDTHLTNERNIRDVCDITINLLNGRYVTLEEIDNLVNFYLLKK